MRKLSQLLFGRNSKLPKEALAKHVASVRAQLKQQHELIEKEWFLMHSEYEKVIALDPSLKELRGKLEELSLEISRINTVYSLIQQSIITGEREIEHEQFPQHKTLQEQLYRIRILYANVPAS
jgi:septation ring formation regulator EzrA